MTADDGKPDEPFAAICGLEDPVRRRLYDYVAGRAERVTRDEAAAAAGVGRPLAAYHLDRLVAVGLLEAGYERPGGRAGPGAGRPAKVYERSDREFAVTVPPREYELAARLLAQAVASDPSGATRRGLSVAARDMGAQMGLAACPPAGLPAWQAMTAALRAHQFEPQDDEAGRLYLRNCPFHQLAAQHPEVVCAMNLALIEGLADGLSVGASLRAVLDPGPGRCCVVVAQADSDEAGADCKADRTRERRCGN
ncbi:MAG TPA: helix-turn-helix domain-containing protein [Streptosporangiaceae bacterium]